jgi:hypothetical protein
VLFSPWTALLTVAVSLICGVAVYEVLTVMGFAKHRDSSIAAVLFAVLVYYFVLRKLGGLTDEDIEQISPKLLKLLKKIKLA